MPLLQSGADAAWECRVAKHMLWLSGVMTFTTEILGCSEGKMEKLPDLSKRFTSICGHVESASYPP